MPIFLSPLNIQVRVLKVLTDDKTKKHLESLEITINSFLTVLSSNAGGVVVLVKDGRLALDRNISSKIFVA